MCEKIVWFQHTPSQVCGFYMRHIYKLKQLLRYSRRWDGSIYELLGYNLLCLDLISCNTLITAWWICLKNLREDCSSCVKYSDDEIQVVRSSVYSLTPVRNSCLPELALLATVCLEEVKVSFYSRLQMLWEHWGYDAAKSTSFLGQVSVEQWRMIIKISFELLIWMPDSDR